MDNHRGKKNLVLSSWGDESVLFEDYVNPCYIPDFFESYSEQTRQNLVSTTTTKCMTLHLGDLLNVIVCSI